ncbi:MULTISPECIES: energy transducer TonB [Halomonadaceae]|uniref:Outer membrane transport energization protein TonB n=1 Tax=Onishia taeanensis TaxID=284577 RepID=A0A328XVB7_9GAMM|nr:MULTISPECIES: energy transducer TonB [Halomonas]RAR59595.1 outer membrane transport energization protein TonB [Halomonas taeanensis]
MAWLGDVVSVPFGVASDDSHAPVTRGYRHVFAWAVAIGLHLILLALVAGVSLPTPPAPASSHSLDVVLVSRPAATPERASAIAEAAQEAARLDTAAETAPDLLPEATPEPANASATPEPASAKRLAEQVAAPSPEPVAEPEPAPDAEPEPLVAAEPVSEPVSEPVAEPVSETKAPSLSGRELAASATASLRERDFAMSEQPAELADQEQQAAREAAEARYVDAWTRRVQDYGNRFYPAPPDLDGQLKVRVVIDHQGQLLQAEVVQSSGHPELDQAALDTIRGAAPYRPFDRGMAGLDRLSISRIWRFGTGNDFGVR